MFNKLKGRRLLGGRPRAAARPVQAVQPTHHDAADAIRASGLFDGEFYVGRYPDARAASDPLQHYLSIPASEARLPGPNFDAATYLKANPDVASSGLNALVHYVLFGRAEGRPAQRVGRQAARPPAPAWDVWEDLAARWNARPPREPLVDVIVPVYRGFDETANCIRTLVESRIEEEVPCRLVVIDDCGPEPELSALLDKLAELGLFTLHRNAQNLGFVATVNRGMSLSDARDVVLLNSDTEVYGDWVERLRRAAYSQKNIGTVTPFTNNGTICSYPKFCGDFSFQLEVDFRELDLVAREANAGRVVDVPTGVGFCLYIRRECINEVGLFDVERFGLGYGEENDFCMRIGRAGWRNVLAGDIFVRHLGGTSFLNSTNARVQRALKILETLYPGYQETIRTFCLADPPAALRRRLDVARLRRQLGGRAILFVAHNLGGGTEQHVQDMAALLKEEGVGVVFLRPQSHDGRLGVLSVQGVDHVENLGPVNVYGSPDDLADLVRELGVFQIHVHHLLGFHPEMAEGILRLAEVSGLPYDVTVHDYSPVCPRVNMIDASGLFCDVKPSDIARCEACIGKNGNNFGAVRMWKWRLHQHEMLRGARRVFVPNKDVRARLNEFFENVDITVRPHPESLEGMPRLMEPRRAGEVLRVAVIGAIGPNKGSKVLLECARHAEAEGLPIKFVVIGYSNIPKLGGLSTVEITGRYAVEKLADVVAAQRCHLAFFPAVWPETFSYTLSQAFAMGLYPVAFDMGAIAERIRAVGWGRLLPFDLAQNPRRLNEELLACAPYPMPDAARPFLQSAYGSIINDYYLLAAESPTGGAGAMSGDPAADGAAELSSHVATVAGRYGPIAYFDFDAVIGRALQTYGEWAQNEVDFLLSLVQPGATVIDGGAHVGVFSQALACAAGVGGTVISFEPNPSLYALLCRNVAVAGPASDRPVLAALGSAAGQLTVNPLRRPEWRNLGSLSVQQLTAGDASAGDAVTVPVMAIDDLGLERLDLIKLDIEGMEPAAIEGAWQTITRHQPLLHVECNAAGQGWEICDRLLPLGYEAHLCRFNAFNPDNIKGCWSNFFGKAQETSLLFVPPRLRMVADRALAGVDSVAVDSLDALETALARTKRYGDGLDTDAIELMEWLREAKTFLTALKAGPDAAAEAASPTRPADELTDLMQRYGVFDPDYYRRCNPTLVGSDTDLLYHYLTDGWKTGRRPSPSFDGDLYLRDNADVAERGANPLLHLIFFGRAEGRAPARRDDAMPDQVMDAENGACTGEGTR